MLDSNQRRRKASRFIFASFLFKSPWLTFVVRVLLRDPAREHFSSTDQQSGQRLHPFEGMPPQLLGTFGKVEEVRLQGPHLHVCDIGCILGVVYACNHPDREFCFLAYPTCPRTVGPATSGGESVLVAHLSVYRLDAHFGINVVVVWRKGRVYRQLYNALGRKY